MSRAIRPYRAGDLARLREICLLTGNVGGDATGLFSSDELLADVYLEPYVTFAPGWAWVIDEGDGPLGYVVAVSDTPAFVGWWRERWTPWFAERYVRPEPPYSPEEELVLRGYLPGVLEVPEVDDYPSHLHIDLLPEAQGRGHGRTLIGTLRSQLAKAGVAGVTASLDPANTAARGFYERLGFAELPSSTADAPLLGLRTAR